jgi:hypothetical protein
MHDLALLLDVRNHVWAGRRQEKWEVQKSYPLIH